MSPTWRHRQSIAFDRARSMRSRSATCPLTSAFATWNDFAIDRPAERSYDRNLCEQSSTSREFPDRSTPTAIHRQPTTNHPSRCGMKTRPELRSVVDRWIVDTRARMYRFEVMIDRVRLEYCQGVDCVSALKRSPKCAMRVPRRNRIGHPFHRVD